MRVPEKVILVMGVTGAGKSRFIRTITGDSRVTVGDTLRSTTQIIASYGAVLDGQPYRFLDTPGFNDTERSETDILLSLVTWLCDLYRTGVTISGVLYFHRISDERMQGSTLRNLRAFEAICGDASMRNVAFVTTYWDRVSLAVGEERETELKEAYWMVMIQKGANMARFDGTLEGAKRIVRSLQSREDTVLAIQREVVIDKRELSKTDVGRIINKELERNQKQLENELHQVQDSLRSVTKMSDEMQAQMAAQAEKIQKELEQANVKKEWDLIRYERELLRWEERYSKLAFQVQEKGERAGTWEFFWSSLERLLDM
ncbi:P-loop containing nucleoside triphosphate hydrolase protein [Tirmania nivea]|nr:P-loop containing nucleoside triphosphate hydrolase protein [Tirmania nivea]